MSRLNVITPERMSPEQRKVYEESVAAGTPTGTTGGPYTAFTTKWQITCGAIRCPAVCGRCSCLGR
jgi:hypothetical protein